MTRRIIFLQSFDEKGDYFPEELEKMLKQIGAAWKPVYDLKIVPRPGRDEWTASVNIYNGPEWISGHNSPAPRSTRRQAVTDAAWEAITALSHTHKERLAGTRYGYYPQRESGGKTMTADLVKNEIPFHHTVSNQKAITWMSARLLEAQEEIRVLRDSLQQMEGGASNDQADEKKVWSVSSPDRAPVRYPPMDSRDILRVPSSAGSASSHA